jgi:hypothetical protein
LKYPSEHSFYTHRNDERTRSGTTDFPYLTLVDEEGKEYRMERQSMYKYSVTETSRKDECVYSRLRTCGENGNELTLAGRMERLKPVY